MAKIISAEFIHELQHIVGKKHVSASAIDTEVYSYDASPARGRSGAVVFPANSQEVARVVQTSCQFDVPFIPRGFGTNLSGGTVASSGGVVICLSRLNRVLKLSPERRQAVVQPGVTNLELQDALGSMGLFFAPDPASQKVATLGGNVGENSGGPHCLKYGVTTNHILGLEAVLPDGEVVRFGGPALDPPGFDLRGVMVGSEGTLGIVTEITVRILPKPETVITMLAVYDAVSDAARSVSDIVAAGIIPATLEMMDSLIIQAVEDSFACGYPRDAAAVLIIEVEGPSAGLEEQAECIQASCMKNRCRRIHRAADDQERDRLWEGRRGAFGAIARLAPNFVLNDCTVPRTKLPEALARIDAIAGTHQLRHGNVFHAGDGNLHPLIFYDAREPGQSEKARRAAWEIMETCVELGGAISGEHGIGLEKLEAMRLIFSEHDLEFQRTLKNAFDPHGLLNPGKVVPAPREEHTEPRARKNRSDPDTQEVLAAIVETVKQAVVEKQALSPIGNGTWREWGNQCAPKPVPLKTSRLSRIAEFDHANQVVTAGAGVSLINIQKRLRSHNQWLPIRPLPFLLSHSLGGMVATGACGPERAFYGAPRDLLLGLQLVDPHGRLVSTGGKVIKNVAGYDMTRLMAGSMGTLGLITEVTLRTAMIPEHLEAIVASGSFESCSNAVSDILNSTLEPVFMVIAPSAENNSSEHIAPEWKISVGFEGFSQTVDYLLQKCRGLMDKHGLASIERMEYGLDEGMFKKDYEGLYQSPFVFRAHLPLDRQSNLAETVTGRLNPSDFFLDCRSGVLTAGMEHISEKDWSDLCGLVGQNEGHIRLDQAPHEFKTQNDVFGPPTLQWKIMHNIKQELDPHAIFAPGRLPGKV